MNLPLAYISKDIISKYDFGCTLKGQQIHRIRALVSWYIFRLWAISTDKEIPIWLGMEPAAIFFNSLSRPSISQQNTKLNVTTNETQVWLLEEAKLLFPIHCHSLLPSTPVQDLLHPMGGLCHSPPHRRHRATMANQQVLYCLPWECKWLWDTTIKPKAKSQEKS